MSLFDDIQADVLEAFNSTSTYLDYLLNIDNPYVEGIFSQIYPAELQLNKANISDTGAPFFDLLITLITYDSNSTSRFKMIKRHETELKWIKLLQTPYPLGFNDNIYHEGNLSKMPDFDVFSLLEFRKRKARSHGIKKNGNCKRKSRVQKLANCTLRDLATKLDVHGRHCMLSYLSSLPISVLRSLDTEANKFYDRTNRLYDAAILTRCYTQHALRPVIDSKINHIRHFIKIPFINKGMDFIDLPSIFRDKSVQSPIPNYFKNCEVPIICYKYNKLIRGAIFNFNKLVSDLDIETCTPDS